MFKKMVFLALFFFVSASGAVVSAQAFQGPGCMGKCTDCHTLSKEEASKLIKADKFKAQIKDIRMSPVKGLWEVEVTQGDKNVLVYVDFGKGYLVEARFTKLEQLGESEAFKKVDLKKIPVDGAILMGSASADKKVIVFDDPDCPYCQKLHQEIKKILEKRKDLAFYIKMFPLPMHTGAYEKSKAIVCKKSAKLLDDAFAGKTLPKAECKTAELDNNIKLAEELGIRGTPAIILPDGRLVPGYVTSDVLLGLIDNPQ